jgi:hypothetical protein
MNQSSPLNQIAFLFIIAAATGLPFVFGIWLMSRKKDRDRRVRRERGG